MEQKACENSSSCPLLNEYNERINELQNKLEDIEILLKALALQGISKELKKIVRKKRSDKKNKG